MKVSLIINHHPLSVNAYYYYPALKSSLEAYKYGKVNRVFAKPVRSADARNWARLVFQDLGLPYNQDQLEKFRNSFDQMRHGIGVNITVYHETSKLLTKAGYISSKSKDLSNIEKPLIDLIFDPKYAKRKMPEGCQNLQLNDKFILKLKSKKCITNSENCTFVELYLIDLDEIKDLT